MQANIHIIFPPGCYGTYIARCLHHYSIKSDSYELDFDEHSSSHLFRDHPTNDSDRKINFGHYEKIDNKEETIIITADKNHRLDYFNNQFAKEKHLNFNEYIKSLIECNLDEFVTKSKFWNCTDFNETTPIWILREYFSFWITDIWDDGYNNNKYLSLPHIINFSSKDLFVEDFYLLLNKIASSVKLTLLAPISVIQENHKKFISAQKYHNIQNKCNEYVDAIIKEENMPNPCLTIFDESFVQHQLRNHGYEIRCFDLNNFPDTSLELHKFIYNAS